MRVAIWGINYSPEPTGIAPYTTELAEFLRRRGWEVEMVTGFPYYPAWRKRARDRGRFFRTETISGVTVRRCWQYVPKRLSTARRGLHELTFGMTSALRLLALRHADVYLVVSPPLGLGPLAWFVARQKRSRYLFHVQDLQPDSAAGLGMVRPGIFLRVLFACERLAYGRAAGVSVISDGMASAVAAKGVPSDRIFLLPNWLRRPPPAAAAAGEDDFRRRHGIPDRALLAFYSGNLGRKQGLDVLLEAAERLQGAGADRRPVVLVIAGDGGERGALAERLRMRPLANVRLLPLLTEASYRALLRTADLALVTQLAGTGNVCFPSKLLTVLAARLPVFSVADPAGDLGRAVEAGGFGCNFRPGDADALAAGLARAAEDPALCREWAARCAWVERFAPDVLLPRFEQVLRSLATAGGRTARPPAAISGPPRST